MTADPQWAVEAELAPEEVWKRRAEEQLNRARAAEQLLEAVQEELRLTKRLTPLAVGMTEEEAARAFAAKQWPGDDLTDPEVQRDNSGDFRVRCHIDGTSMKIDGYAVPGGFVVTGWL